MNVTLPLGSTVVGRHEDTGNYKCGCVESLLGIVGCFGYIVFCPFLCGSRKALWRQKLGAELLNGNRSCSMVGISSVPQ